MSTASRAPSRLPSNATIILSGAILALALAVGAAWLFVLRPAANDAAANDISVEDFVNTDSRAAAEGTADGTVAEIGKLAPDVKLAGFSGGSISISDLKGKPTVINFWASSCAPCVAEMPLIESVHQELGDDITFLGVDVFEAPEPGQAMIDSTGVTYEQTVDPTNEVMARFGGTQLPHTVILDADGIVIDMVSGPITDRDQLVELIERAK